MKPTVVAPILNAVLPRAGLWYLGEPTRAVVNFLLAVVVTAAAAVSGWEHVHYIFLAIVAGSAGYAHAVARAVSDA